MEGAAESEHDHDRHHGPGHQGGNLEDPKVELASREEQACGGAAMSQEREPGQEGPAPGQSACPRTSSENC